MGLRVLLEQDVENQVCGEAEDIPGALQMLKSTTPDLIILDLELNGASSGLDLIPRIRVVKKHVPILVYSMLEDLHYIERALAAGARGYCSKRESLATVLLAVRAVRKSLSRISRSSRRMHRYSPTTAIMMSDASCRIHHSQLPGNASNAVHASTRSSGYSSRTLC